MSMKDTPILLPDGTEVKAGMTIYSLDEKYVTNNIRLMGRDNYIKRYSGESRAYYEEYKVIAVNRAGNSRSFVARDKSGYEQTFTVKNSRLPDFLYGDKTKLHKAMCDVNKQDIKDMKKRIKGYKEEIANCEKTIKKLARVKR